MSQSVLNGRIRKRDNASFSITPITLPPGSITVHNRDPNFLPNNIIHDQSNLESSTLKIESCPLKQYNLQEIIFPRHDLDVIDHCWTTTNLSKYKDHQMRCNDLNELGNQDQNIFSLLVILGRMVSNGSNSHAGKVPDLSYPSSNATKLIEEKPHIGSVISIYCRKIVSDENNRQNDHHSNNNKGFILINEMKIHSYLTCLSANSNALVTAGTSGVHIYSLYRMLSSSIQFHKQWPYVFQGSILILEPKIQQTSSTHTFTPIPIDTEKERNDPNSMSNDKENQIVIDSNSSHYSRSKEWKIGSNQCHIMISFPIHAIKLCENKNYLLAAASGEQIGVWNLNTIISFLNQTKNSSLPKTLHNKKIPAIKEEEVQVALWSAKVTHCLERITSIEFASTHLACCCWDGTAFVFHPTIETENEEEDTSDTKHKDNQYSWIQYNPLESSNTIPHWEVPPLQGDDRQRTSHTPIYMAISGFQNISLTTQNYNPSWMTSNYMAVSTPGSSIIRCFDLKTGFKCEDLNMKQNSDINDSMIDGTAIHGIISLTLDENTSTKKIYWIDEKDMIYMNLWPHRSKDLMSMRLQFHNLLHRKQGMAIPMIFTNIFKTPFLEAAIKYDASLMFYPSRDSWELKVIAWTENRAEREIFVNDTILIPFLTDDDAIDLMRQSRDSHNEILTSSNETPCSAIICKTYLGIVVPSIETIYIFDFTNKEWIHIDIDDPNMHRKDTIDQDHFTYQCINRIRAWFIDSRYLVSLSYRPNGKKSSPSAQVLVWDVLDGKESCLNSKEFCLISKHQNTNYDVNFSQIVGTMQVVSLASTNSLQILMASENKMDQGSKFCTSKHQLFAWIFDVCDDSCPVVHPSCFQNWHFPSLPVNNTSMTLVGARKQVSEESKLSQEGIERYSNSTENPDMKDIIIFISLGNKTEYVWAYFVNNNVWKICRGTSCSQIE